MSPVATRGTAAKNSPEKCNANCCYSDLLFGECLTQFLCGLDFYHCFDSSSAGGAGSHGRGQQVKGY